jgi:hypothetical protein
VVVTTASATTSCRDPVAATAPSGGSLVAAALSVARGALDECHLVGTDVPDLSALVGARSGTDNATLRTRRQEIELQPLETRASGGANAYLKMEKPRFLFLEGSTGAVVAAAVATAALPGACSSTASAALVEGAQDSSSQGGLPPVAFFFFSLSRRRVLRGRRG